MEIAVLIAIYFISYVIIYFTVIDSDREYSGWQILSLIFLAPIHALFSLILLLAFTKIKLKRKKKK